MPRFHAEPRGSSSARSFEHLAAAVAACVALVFSSCDGVVESNGLTQLTLDSGQRSDAGGADAGQPESDAGHVDPMPIAVTVSPHTVPLAPSGTFALTATVTGTNDKAVTWTIEEGAAGGSITSAGVYTAPATAGTYHLVATSHADPSKHDAATAQVSAAPPGSWVNVTGNLANMASECGNMAAVFVDPNVDMVVTAVALKGVFASTTDGVWTQLGATGPKITNRMLRILYDPAHPGVFWESGIYNGGGVYKTVNSGTTFSQVGSVAHNDSISVDFSDPDRKTMLAGPHEQSQKLYLSTNGGANWSDIGTTLPNGTGFCTLSFIVDAHTFVVGCGGWYGGSPGIYRTTDSGAHWAQVSDKGVAGHPLLASDGNVYWAQHQQGGMLKSTDKGLHWSVIADSSKAGPITPIELPDGRIATAGSNTLMATADQGATWQSLGSKLPYAPYSLAYSPFRKAFYISYATCGNTVPSDGVMRLGYQ